MSCWRTLRFDFTAMASPCSLQIDGQDERAMRRAAQAAMDEVKRIEHKFSRYRASSVLSRVNQAAGQDWTDVDAETDSLLDFADQLWTSSDGLFDITSGVLRTVWNFKTASLPDPAQLTQVLQRIGWQLVERRRGQVRLTQPGMELDFGGFGKEYAADRAAAIVQSHGLHHALVNLGGDLHALGPRGLPEMAGKPWLIEIQHPRPDETHAPLAVLPLSRGGLATSGDYERYFDLNGQRYCHVLNPRTGWPATAFQSVSVLSGNTTAAGAMSTIAMLKGTDGPAWLALQNTAFLAVMHDGRRIQHPTPARG